MAAGGVAALGGILGGISSAFSHQSRSSPGGGSSPRQDTSTPAMAVVKDRRQLRELRKNAREERILALATDPQVMGLLVTLGGLVLSCRMPFHPDPATNAQVQGLAAASCVLMGLGRAGVGDLTTMTVAAGAGLAVGGSGLSGGGLKIAGKTIPWYAALGGPIGQAYFALQEAT